MRRRGVIFADAGAVGHAASQQAFAQAGNRPRLAVFESREVVTQMSASGGNRLYRAFFRELHRLDRVEGTNLTVERWSANGDGEGRLDTVARDVVASRPDAIFAGDSLSGMALRTWTSEIPIVVAGGSFLAWGAVKSLSRPGGNLTGISIEDSFELVVKQVELLHESMLTATSAALLGPISRFGLATDAWRRRGLVFVGMEIDHFPTPSQYRHAFAAAATEGAGLVVVAEHIANYTHRALIVELAAQHRLPAIFPIRDPVKIGGLMSYGIDYTEWGLRVAGYVVRVLRGEKPAELPVQVIDKFEFVINSRTARTLGLTIPPAILARADEVIE